MRRGQLLKRDILRPLLIDAVTDPLGVSASPHIKSYRLGGVTYHEGT